MRLRHRESRLRLAAALVSAAVSIRANSEMMDDKLVEIDFSDVKAASERAVWSPANELNISSGSLGLRGAAAQTVEIVTKEPFALGWSWRPTDNISLSANVEPRTLITESDSASAKPRGVFSVRYSPDFKNWSQWIDIPRTDRKSTNADEWPFSSFVAVSTKDSKDFEGVLREYSALDVPWKSDVEAAVKWKLSQEPDYFKRVLPFMGYVELRLQIRLEPGEQIKKVAWTYGYTIGGMHATPKDKSVYDTRFGKWRFKADDVVDKGSLSSNGQEK